MRKRWLVTVAMMCSLTALQAQTTDKEARLKESAPEDTVALQGVTVVGKTNTQRLREGALSVNAIDVRSMASSIHSISELVDRTAGVKKAAWALTST